MAETHDKKEFFIGVDLGGTKILSGLFDQQLQCLGRSKVSTKAERGADAVIERIARCVEDVIDECDLNRKQVRGVGVGTPGSIDREAGKVLFAANLGWENVPLQKELERRLDVPVSIENDCNACMLGVFETELKGKPRNAVGVFLGTGIGGGLILDGKLFSGFNHTAGEVGHMVLEVGGPKCTCGNRGCFEALASRTAIFRKILTAVKAGQKTLLTDMLGDDLKDMRSRDLLKAIKQGDKFIERIVEEAAEYTGIAVANLINLFSPEVVVLGGGIIDALEDEMMAIIVETALDCAFPGTAKGVQIVPSELGDDAGIVGGAVMVQKAGR